MEIIECDVVVVGSGVAGLAAAYEAAQRGARVVVLESEDVIGGASAMSGAACCLVGTPEQAAAGVEDSVELALHDWLSWGGATVDEEWARDYLAHSREDVYEWCRSLGITWGAPVRQEGNSVARWQMPDRFGRGIVDAISTALVTGGVSVRTGAGVARLLEDGGRVVGVDAVGGRLRVHAPATVVATGGFVNNRDFLMRVSARLRSLPRFLLGGSSTACGSGHELLGAAGAGFSHLENVWVYPNATPDPQDPSGRRGLGIRGIVTELWVNLEGRRFHDESFKGGRTGTRALLEQTAQTCWTVFDASEQASLLLIDNEYFASPAGPNPEPMAEFWAQSSHAVLSDSVSELATRTGLPETELRSSIDSFNSAVRAGVTVDPETGRAIEGLTEVGRNGFAALQMFPMAQKNFGGVRTDLSCRVLSAERKVIEGLYAAGEVAGMAGGSINGSAGLEGTMFGPCLYSGRVAGKAAARDTVPA